ncbi:hypothetical protein [Paracoccus salsus]|uniref:hypothetical protein n=1 Tax=Paracoccus salsus TaxID=2911061 RepID=UPI001F1F9C50|nr:hypothetical protein [Paracoccus salsus]MCF3973705.1 hypothetical protein [Paracoccus salsus]
MAEFELVEQALRAKSRDGGEGEDRLVIQDHCAAVIDGATDKTGWRDDGRTGGQIVADTVAAELARPLAEHDPHALVMRLSDAVAARLGACAIPPQGRPNAVFAACIPAWGCVVRVGDPGVMIDGSQRPAVKRVDDLLAEARALYRHLCPALPGAGDPGRAAIMPWLSRQHLLQNDASTPWGFGCIDGNPVPARFIELFPLSDAREVVLCSDGYPAPRPSLAESEALLERLLAEDPDCVAALRGTKGWDPRTARSHDDRSYLRLRLRAGPGAGSALAGAAVMARSK